MIISAASEEGILRSLKNSSENQPVISARAEDVADAFYFTVNFADGTTVDFTPTTSSRSADRMSATLNMGNVDLTGKKGKIVINDFDKEIFIPFDYSVASQAPAAQ